MTWYDNGLQFECTQCGNCCSGPPGVVRFTDKEARAIADHLGIELTDFLERFTVPLGAERQRSLGERPSEHGYDCVFLDRASNPQRPACSIYPVRPLQCRTFPWWPEHLESRRAWHRVARTCEGVGRGDFVPLEAIRVQRDAQRAASRGA